MLELVVGDAVLLQVQDRREKDVFVGGHCEEAAGENRENTENFYVIIFYKLFFYTDTTFLSHLNFNILCDFKKGLRSTLKNINRSRNASHSYMNEKMGTIFF